MGTLIRCTLICISLLFQGFLIPSSYAIHRQLSDLHCDLNEFIPTNSPSPQCDWNTSCVSQSVNQAMCHPNTYNTTAELSSINYTQSTHYTSTLSNTSLGNNITGVSQYVELSLSTTEDNSVLSTPCNCNICLIMHNQSDDCRKQLNFTDFELSFCMPPAPNTSLADSVPLPSRPECIGQEASPISKFKHGDTVCQSLSIRSNSTVHSTLRRKQPVFHSEHDVAGYVNQSAPTHISTRNNQLNNLTIRQISNKDTQSQDISGIKKQDSSENNLNHHAPPVKLLQSNRSLQRGNTLQSIDSFHSNKTMSVASDASSFMDKPMCVPSVTHRKNHKKSILKKLKTIGRSIRISRPRLRQLQILAIV